MVMITFRNHILIKGRFAAYLHSPQANFTAPQGQFHFSLVPSGRISLFVCPEGAISLFTRPKDEFHSFSLSNHTSIIACTTSFSRSGSAAYSPGVIPQRTKHQKA